MTPFDDLFTGFDDAFTSFDGVKLLVGPYFVVAGQVFSPGAVAGQMFSPGAVAGQVGGA